MRLLIMDKARLICDALAAVLRAEPDIAIAGLATSVEDGLVLLQQCDVALVSANLPRESVLRLLRGAAGAQPVVKVVVTGLAEEDVVGYLEAGAAGYMLKEESVEDLLRKMRAACEGTPLIAPQVVAALLARLVELARQISAGSAPEPAAINLAPAACAAQLTPREQQILPLLAQGLSNQEIAARLAIETGTVKNHVHNILRKLRVSTRFQAALSTGTISPRLVPATLSAALSTAPPTAALPPAAVLVVAGPA